MFKHILVPTDGSELSTCAVRRAVSFAKEIGARVTFYFAKPDYAIMLFGEAGIMDSATLESISKIGDQQAEQALASCVSIARDANVVCDKFSSIAASVHQGIIDTATVRGCDLIFMASHGRRGIGGLLLGSETQRVLSHTSIPVLVYR